MAADGRRGLGNAGEALAVRALTEAGLHVVDRNWRCPAGELDIVAHDQAPDFSRDGEPATWLVIVEVRTRRGQAYGTALQSITPRKQAKLREVAEQYVQAHGWAGPWRIDVLAVQMDAAGHLLHVDHVRHAVTG
jgi:putative endonuclease